jgi:hypothetical protein
VDTAQHSFGEQASAMNSAAKTSLIAGALHWLLLLAAFIYIQVILGRAEKLDNFVMTLVAVGMPVLFLTGLTAAFFAKGHRLVALLLNLTALIPAAMMMTAALLFLVLGRVF